MRFGLIGANVAHSYSPEVHRSLGLFGYELLSLSQEQITPFFAKKNFEGINVTIPYKETVIPYLDEVMEEAEEIGAVNTIVQKDERLIGYNTDALGLEKDFLRSGYSFAGKKALILGTGGASKAAAYVLKKMGVSQVVFISRSKEKSPYTYDDLSEFKDFEIVVNATPAGMYPSLDSSPCSFETFERLEFAYDFIYNPLRTKFLLEAKKKGALIEDGLFLLYAQAYFADQLFMGKALPEDLLLKAYEKGRKQRENIVLIGMPGSGKSALGRTLAVSLSREFIDTDSLIEKKIGMSISAFFQAKGEPEFRKIEAEVIASLRAKTSCVISAGGGAILDQRNIDGFSQNGKIIYLARPVESLALSDSRPLSPDLAHLKAQFAKRKPLYEAAADVIVENDGDFETALIKLERICK